MTPALPPEGNFARVRRLIAARVHTHRLAQAAPAQVATGRFAGAGIVAIYALPCAAGTPVITVRQDASGAWDDLRLSIQPEVPHG